MASCRHDCERKEPAEVASRRDEVPFAPHLGASAELTATKPHRLLDLREGPLALRLPSPVAAACPGQAEQPMHALGLGPPRPPRPLPLPTHRDQTPLPRRQQGREASSSSSTRRRRRPPNFVAASGRVGLSRSCPAAPAGRSVQNTPRSPLAAAIPARSEAIRPGCQTRTTRVERQLHAVAEAVAAAGGRRV